MSSELSALIPSNTPFESEKSLMNTGILWYNQQVKSSEPTGASNTESALSKTIHVGGEQQMTEQEFTTEELNNEVWRDAVGYEGVYSVSNLGRIRRDLGVPGARAGRVLNPSTDGGGYSIVGLRRNGIGKTSTVHRIVTAAFFGKRPDWHQVNHKNGLMNTSRGNGHWTRTHPEKVPQGKRRGCYTHPESVPRGEKHYNSKVKDSGISLILQLRNDGLLQREIGEIVGISRQHVSKILKRSLRTSKGMNGDA